MNCDLIAPHYWWIERLGMGRALERRRRWFLPEIGNARRALVLGDGDGRFLRELLRRNTGGTRGLRGSEPPHARTGPAEGGRWSGWTTSKPTR